VCGCGKVHQSGETCPAAAARSRERNALFDKKRPNASRRGYGRDWEEAAKAFLSEPGNKRCARCGAPATVVMHIVSIRQRPELRMVRTNWRPGCTRCNAIEAAEERRTMKGTGR
jgi:5-methylcytosine-specific restriction protein A